MNTRFLMTGSAALMAAAGVATSFLPQELLAACGLPAPATGVLLVQALGALYLGFAALNWMARGNLIGGIYSRPVALGNFMHFAVMSAALLKSLTVGDPAAAHLAITAAYALLALAFGWVTFTAPADKA